MLSYGSGGQKFKMDLITIKVLRGCVPFWTLWGRTCFLVFSSFWEPLHPPARGPFRRCLAFFIQVCSRQVQGELSLDKSQISQLLEQGFSNFNMHAKYFGISLKADLTLEVCGGAVDSVFSNELGGARDAVWNTHFEQQVSRAVVSKSDHNTTHLDWEKMILEFLLTTFYSYWKCHRSPWFYVHWKKHQKATN